MNGSKYTDTDQYVIMGLEMQIRKHICLKCNKIFLFLAYVSKYSFKFMYVDVDIIYLHDELLQQKQLFSLHWFKIMARSKWIYSNSEHPESWQDHQQQTWWKENFILIVFKIFGVLINSYIIEYKVSRNKLFCNIKYCFV